MGDLRRELGRTLAMFSFPVFLAGCQVFLLPVACLDWCSDEEVSTLFAITIMSPVNGDVVDGEPITVEIAIANNTAGAWIIVQAGARQEMVHVDPGTTAADVTILPEQDSGSLMMIASAFTDDAPTLLADQAFATIAWGATWELALAECEGSTCTPIEDGSTLAGLEYINLVPRWDFNRFSRGELSIDGVTITDPEPATPSFPDTDLTPFEDGTVELVATIQRDDGRRATVTRSVQIANCDLLLPASDPIYAYTPGGLALTSSNDRFTIHTIADPSPTPPFAFVSGPASPIITDDANQLAYFSLQGANSPGIYRASYADLDVPLAGEMIQASARALGLALGPDGALYHTAGTWPFIVPGEVWRNAGGNTTRVDVGGLPGAFGLVFDADGTLLVAANDTIVRLTLTAGVETSRSTVVTRSGAVLMQLGLDTQGRLYATDRVAGELLRWASTGAPGSPEVVYSQPDWPNNPPSSLTFVKSPQHCHGLLITRTGTDDARRLVDVGEVRGVP